MSELKKFYNSQFKQNGMPEFSELSAKQLQELKNTIAFGNWKIQKAVTELNQAFRSYFNSPKHQSFIIACKRIGAIK